ncbi:MAG: prepilin-type N-terminal cleavage/methylation domain-containing protein [Deltaproteobacteria bacterium]|jgi:type IV pilus assembly protein PilW|nr:prepilin-type N-terminal cleavage/methylation domain-containing protein [Deltaproteobacteria bacterium]
MIFCHIDSQNKKSIKESSGFTLLELLVGLGIAAIFIMAIVSIFATLTRSYTTQSTSAYVQQAARASLDYMTQNIRMAGFDPRRNAGAGIIEATPTSISFLLDRDSSGIIDNSEEDIAYVYDSTDKEIEEVLDASTDAPVKQPFLDNVTDLSFAYLDSNGDDLGEDPDLNLIKTIDIFVTVEQRSGREKRPVRRTYSARVICRNLGL